MKNILKIALILSLVSWEEEIMVLTAFPDPGPAGLCRIMFWNVENLFDTFDDTLSDDDEYLPYGIRGWTRERYRKKLVNLYKVMLAAGDERPPDIIGLCEIENQHVLFDLLRSTPMARFKYRFVHHNSPDRRGIDVAMLYDPESVHIIYDYAIPVDLTPEGGGKTRDILCTRFAFRSDDTLTILINHWPSKYGGAGRTEEYRRMAARTLKGHVESLAMKYPSEKILVMGDFNDPPDAVSILSRLDSGKAGESVSAAGLYNLSAYQHNSGYGTYRYMGIWELLDQIMVNGNLLKARRGLGAGKNGFGIFSPPFMLERDESFGGMRPYRTYNGLQYREGFSDHLPVYIDLEYRGKTQGSF